MHEGRKHIGKIIGSVILVSVVGVVLFVGILVVGLRGHNARVTTWNEDGYGARGAARGLSGDVAMPEAQLYTKNADVLSSVAPMHDGATMSTPKATDADAVEVAQDKKEMKDGQISMRVDRVDDAVAAITAIAEQYGGSVSATSLARRTDDVKSGTVTVRVPVAQFVDAFAAIKKVATIVTHESTGSEDVTLAYRDLEKRIANATAEEQAYIKVLDQATKISDILEVTRQVQRVRGEIEQMRAQLTYMASQTDHARIDISLSEDRAVTLSDQWRPLQVAKEGVYGLFADMQGFVNILIVLVVRIVPILVMYGAVLWVVVLVLRAVWRTVRRRRDAGERTDV